jgi:transcription antitermination factor NusG
MLDLAPATGLDRRNSDPFHTRSDVPCGGNWCVVQTHSQAERWANANLRRAGWITFLPLAVIRRRDNAIRSLWHRVDVPLFPSYLFLRGANRDLWRPIRETPGVLSVLRTGDRIHQLPDMAVEAVRSALEAVQGLPAPLTPWKPGTPCSLAQGALAGHPAVVLRIDGDHATVSVLLFGALREIQAPVSWLVERQ